MPKNFELKILADNIATLINAERKALGLRELYVVPYLNECSAIRAEEASINYSHIRPNGEQASDVIDCNKFEYGYFEESLAAGSDNVSDTLNQWKNSSKYWSAITNENITHMGIGVFYSPESEYKWYWCTIFTNDLNGEVEHEGQYLPEEINLNRKISIISNDENGEILPECEIIIGSQNETLEFVKLEKNGELFTDFTLSEDKKSIVFQSDEIPITVFNILPDNNYNYYIKSSKNGYILKNKNFNMPANGIEEAERNFVLEMEVRTLNLKVSALSFTEGQTINRCILVLESDSDLSEVESTLNFSLSDDKKVLSFIPVNTGYPYDNPCIFRKIPNGNYKLYARNVPEGFKLPQLLEFSITETISTPSRFINIPPITVQFNTYGLGESDEEIFISGAEFTLTHFGGKPLENVTSNNVDLNVKNSSVSWISDNYATLSRLPTGDYRLTENTPPDGYSTAQTITFSIDSQGNINNIINAVALGTVGIKILHLKYIGAFENAEKLRKIIIPESVKKIGKKSFSGTALKSVKIASDCEYSVSSFPEGCEIEFYE